MLTRPGGFVKMQKLRINDQVIVLKGRDRGKTGKIVKLNFTKKQAWVGGVNQLKKNRRPTEENPQGGISLIDAPINISNIALASPKTKKPSRIRIETTEEKGKKKKVRVAIACGSTLEERGKK